MHEQFAILFKEGKSGFSRDEIAAIYHKISEMPSACNLEAGRNVSHEGLDHGFTFGIFFRMPAGAFLDIQSILGRDDFETVVLAVKFKGTAMDSSMQYRPYEIIAQQENEERNVPIRHFVAWRFSDSYRSQMEEAVEAYRRLPVELNYFLHLETGAVNHMGSETKLPFSVALYSTFRDADAQAAFVSDTRRVRFKDTFVKPFLQEPGGVGVFDFVPAFRLGLS